MDHGMTAGHRLGRRLGVVGLVLVLAGCGGSGKSGPSAQQQVTTAWETFFSAASTVAQKVALLQDGTAFTAFITAQERNPSLSHVTSKVTAVTITGSSANVTYTVQLSAKASFGPLTGTAVEVGSTWLVSKATFCGLVQLEVSRAQVPIACSA